MTINHITFESFWSKFHFKKYKANSKTRCRNLWNSCFDKEKKKKAYYECEDSKLDVFTYLKLKFEL